MQSLIKLFRLTRSKFNRFIAFIIHIAIRNYWIATCFLLPQFAIVTLILARMDGPASSYLLLLGTYVLEGIVAAMIFIFLCNQQKRFFNYLAFGLYAVYIFIIAVQYLSLKNTFSFLPRIALENTDNTRMLLTFGNLSIFLIAIIFLVILLVVIYFQKKNRAEILHTRHIVLILCVSMFADFSARLYAKNDLMRAKPESFRIELSMISYYPPVRSMAGLFFPQLTWRKHSFIEEIPEAEKLEKLKVKIDRDADYPLIKDFIYVSDIATTIKKSELKRPHIIVLFVEGLSARTINYYDQTFEELTPLITNFAKNENSMVVHNYFNHTAATFRGLYGQLCSLYSASIPNSHWRGKYQADFYCLPDYLKEVNYKSIFLDPHFQANDYLNDMLRQLGFDRVMTANDILVELLPGKKTNFGTGLRNELLFEAIYNQVKTWNNASEPQFLASYPIETHAWIDTKDDGVKYGDGKNNALNTIRDLDVQFGNFFEKFKKLDIYQNTVLVFTTDHARYHEETYVKALKEKKVKDYQGFFADKIPLIIHNPAEVSLKDFDARNATSVDFTPSLIHYLGLPNMRNSFVGHSIFERDHDIGLINIGDHFLLTANGRLINITASLRDEHRELKKNIKAEHELIYKNKIWSKSLNSANTKSRDNKN